MSRGGLEDEGRSGGEGDEIDKANLLAQMFNDTALAKARALSKPEQVVGVDGQYPITDCVECGEPIIMARLQMGKIRCVDCQTQLETRRRLH